MTMTRRHVTATLLPLLVLALSLSPRPATAAAVLEWSTYFGGDGRDRITGTAVGPEGHVFVVGHGDSGNLPITDGAWQQESAGGWDLFVAKLSPAGDAVIWCTLLGGSGGESFGALAVHADGRVTVGGTTTSADLPVIGGFQTERGAPGGPANDASDIFVARLSADGSNLEYLTYLGGTGRDEMQMGHLALAESGAVALTGGTQAPDFPVLNAWQAEPTEPVLGDAFLALIGPGGDLAFATYLGGSQADTGAGVAFASDGSVLVVGGTSSTDFPLQDAWQGSFAGGSQDGFVARFAPTGAALFSTYFGGSGIDNLYDVALDPGDMIHLAGQSTSANLPRHPGAREIEHSSEAFVARLTADGQGLLRSMFAGPFLPTSIEVDSTGAAHASGHNNPSATVPAIEGGSAHRPGSFTDAVGVRLHPDGRSLTWAFQLGGSEAAAGGVSIDFASAVAIAPEGGMVFAGGTNSSDFPTLGGLRPAYAPENQFDPTEGFITRIGPGATPSLYEPSARDARSWVDPLTISKNGGIFAFDLGWEESMGDPSYGILVGSLRRLHESGTYDHSRLACELTEPTLEMDWPEGDIYFLVVTVDKEAEGGPIESSYGRDAYGLERPVGDPNCID